MTTYSAITNAEIDQNSPVTEPLLAKIRDNPMAVWEGDDSAPEIRRVGYRISTTSVTSVATVDLDLDFTSYDKFRLVLGNVVPVSTGAVLWARTSADGGSTFASGGADYENQVRGLTQTSNIDTTGTRVEISSGYQIDDNANTGFTGEIMIYNGSASAEAHLRWTGQFKIYSSLIRTAIEGASWRTANAEIDAIRFLFSGGNIESGTFTLYGYS